MPRRPPRATGAWRWLQGWSRLLLPALVPADPAGSDLRPAGFGPACASARPGRFLSFLTIKQQQQAVGIACSTTTLPTTT